MAPEPDARERAFYDHENAEPRRARRAAADWGVNEDIFDRMPSRFGRVERRPEHQEIVLRRDADHASVAVVERDGGRFARGETAAWAHGDEVERGTLVRGTVDPAQPVARVRSDAPGRVTARTERSSRSGDAGELDPRAAARAMMSWGADLDDEAAPMVPGETRTIVLSRDDEPQYDDFADTRRQDTSDFEALSAQPQERKTIKISGHPDRLPVPRSQRRPMTVTERIGHRPDQIVGYAVALGFLLVLIAVLTTGQ